MERPKFEDMSYVVLTKWLTDNNAELPPRPKKLNKDDSLALAEATFAKLSGGAGAASTASGSGEPETPPPATGDAESGQGDDISEDADEADDELEEQPADDGIDHSYEPDPIRAIFPLERPVLITDAEWDEFIAAWDLTTPETKQLFLEATEAAIALRVLERTEAVPPPPPPKESTKMLAPEGATSATHGDTTYEVDEDGYIFVSCDAVEPLLSHGYTLAE